MSAYVPFIIPSNLRVNDYKVLLNTENGQMSAYMFVFKLARFGDILFLESFFLVQMKSIGIEFIFAVIQMGDSCV